MVDIIFVFSFELLFLVTFDEILSVDVLLDIGCSRSLIVGVAATLDSTLDCRLIFVFLIKFLNVAAAATAASESILDRRLGGGVMLMAWNAAATALTSTEDIRRSLALLTPLFISIRLVSDMNDVVN